MCTTTTTTTEALERFAHLDDAVRDGSCLVPRALELVRLEQQARDGDAAAVVGATLMPDMAPGSFLLGGTACSPRTD